MLTKHHTLYNEKIINIYIVNSRLSVELDNMGTRITDEADNPRNGRY